MSAVLRWGRPIIAVIAPLMIFASAGLAQMPLSPWKKAAPFPEPDEELYGVAVNGKLYVIGGWGEGKARGANYEYDPASDKWTKKRSMPRPAHHAAVAAYNSKIYVCGGFVPPEQTQVPTGGAWQPIDDMWEYDPAADSWKTLAPLPGNRGAAVAVEAGGKIHVIGGVTTESRNTLLTVDPKTGASSVFMTVAGHKPGLDGLAFDGVGNVYVTDAHQGIIWKVGQDGGAATAWVESPLLKPTRPPPAIGANGLYFNNKQTALFVANTAQDTIVKIPVSGAPLKPGKPEVFVNRAGGGPDGLIIDEHDNLWIACNQSNEVLVLEPTQGRVIAKLGDFGGIDQDGAPIGFLWSNSLVFHGDDVLVTNLSLNVAAFTSPHLRTVDGPWADQVKVHTVSKIKKRIPSVPK